MTDENARKEAVESITQAFAQIAGAMEGAPRLVVPDSPEALEKLLILKILQDEAFDGGMDAEKTRQALASLGMPQEMVERTIAYLEMTAAMGEELRAYRDQKAVSQALAQRAAIDAVAPPHFTRQ